MLPESGCFCFLSGWASFYLVEPSLHFIPEVLRNNAPFGHVGYHPFDLGIDARNAPARARIFGEPLTVPYKLADVNFIAENSATSPGVASDRGIRPSPPAWAPNFFQIKLASDCPR
jgi:hypothetical protein